MTTNDFLSTIDSFNHITEAGVTHKHSAKELSKKRTDLEKRFDEFKLCCEWITKFSLKPSEKMRNKIEPVQAYNSYFLKHLVERWSGKYISNGAFILAVCYLKIPYRKIYGTPDISVVISLKEEALV